MAVLIASDLSKDMAGNPLLRGVSFKLERRERLTIAGRNGAGKTTLLRMLAGETSVDGGDLSFEKGCKVALHDQRPPRDRDLTLRDYILGGCADLIAVEQDLSRLAQAMADGDEAAFAAYSRAEARLEHAGGWTWRDRATAMVRGLGFDDEDDLDRSLKTFSGGELTRASLARALAGDPDLLLLDEPTNHLDIESLEWLEKTLKSLDTAIVLVAHDRWFLEAVGTAVLELEAGRSRFFPGTWTQWRKELAAREIALGRAIDKQQAEIERLEKFVERFRAKATKAKQAQSRVKRLDKIERIERDPRDREGLKFQFKAPERSGRVVFEMTGGRVEVGADPGARSARRRRDLARARRARVARRPQRRRQDDADRHARGRAAAGRGQAVDRPQREDRPPLPARRRARHGAGGPGSHGGRGRRGAHRPDAAEGARAARALPVQRRGRPEAARRAERRRAPAPVAGDPRRIGRQRPHPRRADEPPRHREPRGARGRAAVLRGRAAARLARSRAAGGGRHADGRGRRTARCAPTRAAGRSTCACARRSGSPSGRRSGQGGEGGTRRQRQARAGASGRAKAGEGRGPQGRRRRCRRCRTAGANCAGERLAAATAAALAEGAGGAANGASNGGLSKNARRRMRELEREIEQAEAALKRLETELADPAAWATAEATAQSTQRHTAAKRAVEEAFARWEALAS